MSDENGVKAMGQLVQIDEARIRERLVFIDETCTNTAMVRLLAVRPHSGWRAKPAPVSRARASQRLAG